MENFSMNQGELLVDCIKEDLPRKGVNTDDTLNKINEIIKAVSEKKLKTFAPVLPFLFSLKGKPYSIVDYFPFEPIFKTDIPRRLLLKTGRQVSKSMSMVARSVVMSAAIPFFSTLFVTPLYEQVRRLSTKYVRQFIDLSPIKDMLISPATENSVLQRSFKNGSSMFFSFVSVDPGRTRGLPANQIYFDEVQDIDHNHIPIVLETLSGQKIRLEAYAGTSKTLDNTIEGLWERSSQAEWCIPCLNCKHLNVPRAGYDLEKMIGDYRDDISEHAPGVICAKCRNCINPRLGRWVHKFPERCWSFAGYHVPQIILPLHYADPERWSELLAKKNGFSGYTQAKFFNEVLGEACDVSTKLVNKSDLEKAMTLPWSATKDNIDEIAQKADNYSFRVLGIDWGGGGEEETSFTTCAVIGYRPDGKIDVIYGEKLLTPHDHIAEAKRLMHIFSLFRCNIAAHDYNGAGTIRETLMVQSGLPEDLLVPIVYYRSAAANLMVCKPASPTHGRNYWQLDKARSLVTLCQAIKTNWVNFFKCSFESLDDHGLVYDFLALVEHKVQTSRGGEIYTVQRIPSMSDDFAHAVNYACSTAWHIHASWPEFSKVNWLILNREQLEAAQGNYYDQF